MAVYDDQFVYNKYFTVKMVDDILKGERHLHHGVPEISSYSINFFGSSEDYRFLALHILHGNLGIVYKRIDNGLFEPESMLMDELDFTEFVASHYQIRPFLTTQDPVDKYVRQGIQASKKGDFAESVRCFDKALEELISCRGGYVYPGNPKLNAHAEILFFKGIGLFQLHRFDDGFDVFQSAIDIHPSIETKIRQFVRQRPIKNCLSRNFDPSMTIIFQAYEFHSQQSNNRLDKPHVCDPHPPIRLSSERIRHTKAIERQII